MGMWGMKLHGLSVGKQLGCSAGWSKDGESSKAGLWCVKGGRGVVAGSRGEAAGAVGKQAEAAMHNTACTTLHSHSGRLETRHAHQQAGGKDGR